MTQRTAVRIVEQAIEDFDSIKDAIEQKRVPVPYPTPTSQYAELIGKIKSRCVASAGIKLKSGRILTALNSNAEKNKNLITIKPLLGNAVLLED